MEAFELQSGRPGLSRRLNVHKPLPPSPWTRRLTPDLVYLECRAETQAQAEDGARSTLLLIGREWFDDENLTIEEKYSSLTR